MKNGIRIRVQVDPSLSVPEVIIRTNGKSSLAEEIAAAVEACVQRDEKRIAAYQGDKMSLLSPWDIIRIYTENRRLIACTAQGEFDVKSTLKDIESTLDAEHFIRVSRFELINIQKVEHFDFSVAGTVNVVFEDGTSTWVARRYVHAVQATLDRLLGREGGNA